MDNINICAIKKEQKNEEIKGIESNNNEDKKDIDIKKEGQNDNEKEKEKEIKKFLNLNIYNKYKINIKMKK